MERGHAVSDSLDNTRDLRAKNRATQPERQPRWEQHGTGDARTRASATVTVVATTRMSTSPARDMGLGTSAKCSTSG
ncbi:MAG: hypothetical protein AAF089_09080 [Bacteroidota bacterium]